jgi:chromate transporter
VGAIVGSVVQIGREAIVDPLTAGIAICSLIAITRFKIPDPLVILAAGAVGYTAVAVMGRL